jgi:WD40 repeat protein
MERIGGRDHRSRGLALTWRSWQLGLAVSGIVLGVFVTNEDIKPGAAAKDASGALIAEDELGAPVWSLAFADASRLAASTTSGEVWLKDLATGRAVRLQEGDGNYDISLAFSPGGRTIAVAGGGTAIRLRDAETGIQLEPLKVGTEPVRSVAFGPDGATLAVGTWLEDGRPATVTVWEWPGRRQLATLDNHQGIVTALAFSSDGSRLVNADCAGDVRIWDTTSWRERARRRAHAKAIMAMAFSPDDRLFATTSYLDGEVRLWDAADGEPRGSLPDVSAKVSALSFSPDATTLAIARGSGSASLWDVASGREAGVVRLPTGSLHSVKFSGDGRRLATGGSDGSVRLWEVARVLDGASYGP